MFVAAGLASLYVAPTEAAETGDDPNPLPPFNYAKLPEAFRPTVIAYKGRHFRSRPQGDLAKVVAAQGNDREEPRKGQMGERHARRPR